MIYKQLIKTIELKVSLQLKDGFLTEIIDYINEGTVLDNLNFPVLKPTKTKINHS